MGGVGGVHRTLLLVSLPPTTRQKLQDNKKFLNGSIILNSGGTEEELTRTRNRSPMDELLKVLTTASTSRRVYS